MTTRIALLILFCAASLRAQSGHWEGSIHTPATDVLIEVDLARDAAGALAGTFGNAAQNVHGFPLSNVAANGTSVAFEIKANGGGVFHGTVSADGKSMTGTFATRGTELPFALTRLGDAKIAPPPRSPAIAKELEGKWSGTLDVEGTTRQVGLKLRNDSDGTSTGVIVTNEGVEVPITGIAQKGTSVTLEVKNVGGTWAGTLKDGELAGTWTQGPFTGPLAFRRAAANAVERWAKAVGGREKVAAVNAIYREGTIELGGMKGSIKVWHTADGKYRKEEQLGAFASVETFDGTNGAIKQGDAPARAMAGPELVRTRSARYANWNAVFFAFFPERRHGTLTVDGDTVVLQPEGGIDWHVTLDPQSALPKSMTHQQGDRTITVAFAAYETVDGLQIEKEIHRATGDPRFDATIRFTKTVINPPVEASMFEIR